MATYNAKKLTIVKGSDTYIIDPMQGNETGYTTIPVTIAENAWSGTGPYTYVWANSHVTSNSSVTVYLVDGVREGLMGDLNYTKTTGQITFATDEPPIGPIPILVAIADGSVAGVLPIDAEVVETDAIVGETTVQGALEDIDGRVNTINTSKGAANGIATLDVNGLVPSSQLPSYVDDVLEYASLSNFPATGESGKIYVAIDTGFNYRWSGSVYTQIAKYNEATDTVSGLMSSTDKSKLDGISSGATANVVSNSLSDTSTTNALSAAKGKELYDALGAKSSASAVTGDDAFSKINSLNSNLTIHYREATYTATMGGLNYGGYTYFGTVTPAPNSGEVIISFYARTGGGIPLPCSLTENGLISVISAGADTTVEVHVLYAKQG